MLFKSTAGLKEYAQLTGEINFASVRPTLRFVETFHLIAILGRELYRSLDAAYADETTMTAAQKALLEQCRHVVAPYFCYYYAPKADVQLSDAGMTKSKDAAYQYQGAAYREAALREAEMCEESLLQFLEEKRSDYAEWTASEAFKAYRSLFIKSGTQFDDLVRTASPQRNFFALRSAMVDVEENMIRTAIGDTLFNALKTKDAGTQNFTGAELILLQRLKKAIAYQTLATGAPLLNVRLDAAGLSVITAGPRADDDKVSARSNATDNNLSLFIESCAGKAKIWLQSATAYLHDNASALGYTVPAAPKETTSVNADLRGGFGLA